MSLRPRILFPMEMKSVSGYAGHAVRRGAKRKTQMLSTRISKLAKKMKIANPMHLQTFSLGAAFSTISTTGTLLDVMSTIAQGDDYLNRFSSSCRLSRLNLKAIFFVGSTSASASKIRITVIRGESGLAFASNTTGSYSPIVTGTVTKLYYDKFFQIGPTAGAPQWQSSVNLSLPIKHKQKFSGTGAGTTTGDCIYMIIQGINAAGTTCPVASGVLEVFFEP